ncbi:MAG TPA: porin [Ramlibacter sp.]|nr:porin [Ramlibacter sp.]
MSKIPSGLFIACALAASGGQASAQSSVVIGGTLDAFVGSRQLSGAVRTTRVDSGGLTTSQLNFSGTEDLGSGLKAEFVLGMFLRLDAGEPGRFAGDAFYGRSSYVGLAGPAGTLRLGRQTTGHFLNFIRTNAFADSATFGPAMLHTWLSAIGQGPQFLSGGPPAANRSLTGVLGTTDTAWNNALGYTSPNLAGFTFNAQWAPSESAGVGSRKGLSVFYASGPLSAGLATEQMGHATVPASGPAAAVLARQATWDLTAAYAFPFARLSAGTIATRRDFTAIVDDKVRTVHMGASVPVGAGAVLVQVASSRQTPDSGAATRRTTASVAYDHYLSKRTDLYAVAMSDKFSGRGNGHSLALGVRHRF